MSHNQLRKEKNCLNCGHTVEERYCPHCGQENIELHDSTLHLLLHFIQDIFHYEGRTWHTLRNLIRKPGQVAAEYLEGKRVLNIPPIRLYFFTSTIFFLLLFYLFKPDKLYVHDHPLADLNKRMHYLKEEKKQRMSTSDTLQINQLIVSLQQAIDSTRKVIGDTLDPELVLDLGDSLSNAVNESDSLGWFEKLMLKRTEERRKELEEQSPGDNGAPLRELAMEIFHKLPQLIFLSLPFFAFFLKIMYFRSKHRLYVDHFIFSIYQYAYLYSVLTVYFLLSWLSGKVDSDTLQHWIGNIQAGIVLYLFIYLLLAMKRFYAARWRYLLPKYVLLMMLMTFTLLCLVIVIGLITYLL
jgi:hypothetical protein